ncbi:porin, partial [Burkholderia gladioli]
MKRISLLALPAIASLATGVAHAQSTVTLYGIVDAGIAYVHNAQGANGANQSTLVKFNSGNMSGSRWGLRGTEDLGGGLA